MWFNKDTNQKYNKKTSLGIDFIEIKGDEGAPVILLLHGFGADHEDLASLSSAYTGKRKPTWIFPNGPLKVQMGFFTAGRSWFPVNIALLQKAFQEKKYEAIQNAFPQELDEIRKKIDLFLTELNIAPHNLIIGGFSQGAVLAIEIALHAFERPLGLAIFSGTLVNTESWRRLAKQKASLHFFQSHRKHDNLLPFEKAKQLEELLIEGGLKGKLHSFQGGHEIDHSTLLSFDKYISSLIEP